MSLDPNSTDHPENQPRSQVARLATKSEIDMFPINAVRVLNLTKVILLRKMVVPALNVVVDGGCMRTVHLMSQQCLH